MKKKSFSFINVIVTYIQVDREVIHNLVSRDN